MSINNTTMLSELESLERTGRLIKLDYPYRPRRRPWDAATSKTYELINRSSGRYALVLEQMAELGPFFEKIQVYSDSSSDLAPR
jgi:hypothetical protein